MTALEEMAQGQKFIPDYGYSGPMRTKAECPTPAFMDHNFHRVGWFKVLFDKDGLPGWIIEKRCVNCGKIFPEKHFAPDICVRGLGIKG